MLRLSHAPVAQLDRAAASEAVGQKFESSRAHHSFLLDAIVHGSVTVYHRSVKKYFIPSALLDEAIP